MKRNVVALSERNCTGCGACSSTCPTGAITMRINADGFYAPQVDDEKCVDCGACQRVCYKFTAPETHTAAINDKPVLGTYSSDKRVQGMTTSGGFAYELSRWGIENGYKVLGVVYDVASHCAVTVLTSTADDLLKLKGSKYVQSLTQEGLRDLVTEAKSNPAQKYICIGTPCQIFGLRQLIEQKKLKNEFLLVDLFCHGVPSYLVWHQHIERFKEKLGEITGVNFRYKGNGWHQYTIRIDGEKGSYTQYAYKDTFYRYFFDNVALNASCFDCPFRKRLTAADLRIGDFLGGAYERRDDGVSAILVASSRGQQMVDLLHQKGALVVDRQWEASVCLAAQSTHDYSTLPLRNAVIARLRDGNDIQPTQRWYFSQLPLKTRFRTIAKIAATMLPNRLLVVSRRLSRI